MPPQERLAFYASRFPVVEINSCFYRLPSPGVLRTWHDATPPGFRFSAKASRFITHLKKLGEPALTTGRFLRRMSILREKLVAVLFQLPPFWKFHRQRLEEFAGCLVHQKILPDLRFAMEFRNPSWLVPESFEILRRHGIALVHSDPPGLRIPRMATADFYYLRRHRPEYSRDDLKRESVWIQRQSLDGRDILCFFNNDAGCAAVRDAAWLTQKIRIKKLPPQHPGH